MSTLLAGGGQHMALLRPEWQAVDDGMTALGHDADGGGSVAIQFGSTQRHACFLLIRAFLTGGVNGGG